MKLFYKHLYLFDTLKKIKKINVGSFDREKVFEKEDIVLYILKNNQNEIFYQFAIADTDINAIYSFFQDEKFKSYSLLYILRKEEIYNYLKKQKNYGLSDDNREKILKEYNQILSRDLNDTHELYLNMRLFDATVELDETNVDKYLNEFEKILREIKSIVNTKDEMSLDKEIVNYLVESLIKKIDIIHLFYSSTKIENFLPEKSYDYINQVTLNRLSDIEKLKIKNYYSKLHILWDFHKNNDNVIKAKEEAKKILEKTKIK